MDLVVYPAVHFKGTVRVPGDKSISHRALILSAIATGVTRIRNFLVAQDCLGTLAILRLLGVPIHIEQDTVVVAGVGLRGLRSPAIPLDCGNSGTTMRILAGVLVGQSFNSTLTGDASLRKRPMDRVIQPLTQMGARLSGVGFLSIIGNAGKLLHGIDYHASVPSAQVKSAVLLAGLYAQGTTTVYEKQPTRDHTERLLQLFGAKITVSPESITLSSTAVLIAPGELTIAGDISSAAFIIVGACLCPGAHVLIQNVGINPTRIGCIDILRAMGAKIVVHPKHSDSLEPVADIEVWGQERLRGITIAPASVVSAIDEFPIIFIAAACAQGKTILRGATELRYKESDRIQAMATGLSALGVTVEVLSDGLIIEGQENFAGGELDSMGDHRLAMAFTIASLRSKAPIMIKNTHNIATSFPDFIGLMTKLGLRIEKKDN